VFLTLTASQAAYLQDVRADRVRISKIQRRDVRRTIWAEERGLVEVEDAGQYVEKLYVEKLKRDVVATIHVARPKLTQLGADTLDAWRRGKRR
jgi:hypothetical protein